MTVLIGGESFICPLSSCVYCAGVIHDGVMSPGTKWDTRFFLSFVKTSFCMTSKFCRGYAREQDVL